MHSTVFTTAAVMIFRQAIARRQQCGLPTRRIDNGEHPHHLRRFGGILQADAYAGFHHFYVGGRIQEAACWGLSAAQVLRFASGTCFATVAIEGLNTDRGVIGNRS